MHDEISKVKPVYKCQSREPENVAFMSSCQYLWIFLFLIAPSLFSNVYIQVENYMHYPLIEIMRLIYRFDFAYFIMHLVSAFVASEMLTTVF
jgi:hypothetical protein